MKKALSVVLIICIIAVCVFTFVKIYNKKETADNKLQITTTIFPYYSFASEICSSNANTVMLLKPGSESHTYEPTTEDIMTITNSDIFIYTGGESDKWVETILSSIDQNDIKIIKIMDYIDPLENEHQHHTSYDEHVWTSLKNACSVSEIIYETVSIGTKVLTHK